LSTTLFQEKHIQTSILPTRFAACHFPGKMPRQMDEEEEERPSVLLCCSP